MVNGKSIPEQPLYDTATLVGSVFQNPRSQFFNVGTTSELSFGCENLGMPKDEILRRLQSTASALHIEKLLGCSIFDLSGGEKQKIACGSAFMMDPAVYVLDEPSSNLDSDSILDLRATVAYLKSLGKTVVLSEHRLYYLRGIADRYVYMRDGRIKQDFTADTFAQLSDETRHELGLRANDLSTLRSADVFHRSRATAVLEGFRFAYKNTSEVLHIDQQRHRAQRRGEKHLFTLLLRTGKAVRDGLRERNGISRAGSTELVLHGHAGRRAPAVHGNRFRRSSHQHGGGKRKRRARSLFLSIWHLWRIGTPLPCPAVKSSDSRWLPLWRRNVLLYFWMSLQADWTTGTCPRWRACSRRCGKTDRPYTSLPTIRSLSARAAPTFSICPQAALPRGIPWTRQACKKSAISSVSPKSKVKVEKNPPILMADSFRIHSNRISDMATTILIKALKMRRMHRLCEYWLEFLFFGAQHTGRQRFPGTRLFLRAKREPDDLHFHHAVADLRKETEKAADRRNPQIVVAEHIAAAGHLQTTIPRG